MGSDKHHRNVAGGFVGFEPGAHFKAVHARHDHVQKDQVWRVVLANGKCLCTTGGHEYLAIPGERLVHDLDVDGLVVNHQQFRLPMGVVQQINEGRNERRVGLDHGLV